MFSPSMELPETLFPAKTAFGILTILGRPHFWILHNPETWKALSCIKTKHFEEGYLLFSLYLKD